MKNAIIIAAVAGLATAAAAQSAQLTLTPSATTVDTTGGATFELELNAVGFGDQFILGSDGISLQNVGDQGLIDQTPTDPDPSSPPLDGGVGFQVAPIFDGSPSFPLINNGGWNQKGNEIFQGVGWGWDLEGEGPATADDPLIGTYIVKVLDGSVGRLDFEQFQFNPNTFLISTTNTGFDITEYQASDVTFGTASVNLVPAPSALALVGLGGLVAGRRRR